MKSLRTSIALLGAVSALLLAAAPALAANPVADCNTHGTLTQQYTPAQLRNGINTMPADIREYTGCYDVLQRALLATLGKPTSGGGGSGSGSGGSFLPTALIIVLVLLGLVAATFAAIALRRRQAGGPPGPGGAGGSPGPASPGPASPGPAAGPGAGEA